MEKRADGLSGEGDRLFSSACSGAGISESEGSSIVAKKLAELNFDLVRTLQDDRTSFQQWLESGFLIRRWEKSWKPGAEEKFCGLYFTKLFETALNRKQTDFATLVRESIKRKEMMDPITRTLSLANPLAKLDQARIEEKEKEFQDFALRSVMTKSSLSVPVIPLGESWRIGENYFWSWKIKTVGIRGLDYAGLSTVISQYAEETFSISLKEFQRFLCILGIVLISSTSR